MLPNMADPVKQIYANSKCNHSVIVAVQSLFLGICNHIWGKCWYSEQFYLLSLSLQLYIVYKKTKQQQQQNKRLNCYMLATACCLCLTVSSQQYFHYKSREILTLQNHFLGIYQHIWGKCWYSWEIYIVSLPRQLYIVWMNSLALEVHIS